LLSKTGSKHFPHFPITLAGVIEVRENALLRSSEYFWGILSAVVVSSS
jgi:hypothetical protein